MDIAADASQHLKQLNQDRYNRLKDDKRRRYMSQSYIAVSCC